MIHHSRAQVNPVMRTLQKKNQFFADPLVGTFFAGLIILVDTSALNSLRAQREPKGRDEKEQVAEDGGERAGGMLPLLPVSNSICQWPIGNWQHLHIGNILKTPRQPMRQMVGTRVPRVRNVPPTQHQRRTIADGSESRPYHAALPR